MKIAMSAVKRRSLERGHPLGSSACVYYLSLWSVEEEGYGGDRHRDRIPASEWGWGHG